MCPNPREVTFKFKRERGEQRKKDSESERGRKRERERGKRKRYLAKKKQKEKNVSGKEQDPGVSMKSINYEHNVFPKCNSLGSRWALYKMVARNMLRTYEKKNRI